jgi:prostaglandin-endoperoxide synthase 2
VSKPSTPTALATTLLRDTSRDGLWNKVEESILGGFRPFWAFVNSQPWLARFFNKHIVNIAVLKAPVRPLALSTMSPYASWSSLTDRTWFARYLSPRTMPDDLPTTDQVAELFRVRSEGPRLSKRSTLLFASFAQWFTDGFLMTNIGDRKRTRTNHQIDLCQLYGLPPAATRALRRFSEAAGQKGRLKSEMSRSEEWAPRLFDTAGAKKAEFLDLPDPVGLPPDWPLDKKASLFAFGGERANATAYTAAINTLFLREHNRLCGILEAANPDDVNVPRGLEWDDERIFQTARNINIVQLIKIVVEEYINHITPYWFRLLGDPSPCYSAVWNRENWIPVEFNLLYRWHSLVPELAWWNGGRVQLEETRFNHLRLRADGLGEGFDSASRSEAWQMGLFNTCSALLPVEKASIGQGRDNLLASYNDYREIMHYPRVTRFEQISCDPLVVDGLRRVYGHVDRIEFFPGLFAEGLPARSAVPRLLGRMVAADAFSHALTNPLLSPHVFNEATFSREGMDVIRATSTLKDIVDRNVAQPAGSFRVSMEQEASFA